MALAAWENHLGALRARVAQAQPRPTEAASVAGAQTLVLLRFPGDSSRQPRLRTATQVSVSSNSLLRQRSRFRFPLSGFSSVCGSLLCTQRRIRPRSSWTGQTLTSKYMALRKHIAQHARRTGWSIPFPLTVPSP